MYVHNMDIKSQAPRNYTTACILAQALQRTHASLTSSCLCIERRRPGQHRPTSHSSPGTRRANGLPTRVLNYIYVQPDSGHRHRLIFISLYNTRKITWRKLTCADCDCTYTPLSISEAGINDIRTGREYMYVPVEGTTKVSLSDVVPMASELGLKHISYAQQLRCGTLPPPAAIYALLPLRVCLATKSTKIRRRSKDLPRLSVCVLHLARCGVGM